MELSGFDDGAHTAKGAQAKEDSYFDLLLEAELEVPDDEDWGCGEQEVFESEVCWSVSA